MSAIAAPKLPSEQLQILLDESRLPSLPGATLRIMELAGDPFTSLDHVSAVVATDPALAGRVLGLANSVLYNRGRPFERIDRAVAHLGVMQIRSLALALSLFSIEPRKVRGEFDYPRYWRYCLTCAVAAKLVGRHKGGFDPEEAFIAALLQDIGVLALQQAYPKEYARILKEKSKSNLRLHELELERWGFDHADVGAALAAHWKLPRELGNAIRLHCHPSEHPLARACFLGELVHDCIYAGSAAAGIVRLNHLRTRIGDETDVLGEMQIEVPHIAEACSCPSWDHHLEDELKRNIQRLLAAE